MKELLVKITVVLFIMSCLFQFSCNDNPLRPVDSNDFIAEEDFSFLLDLAGQTSLRLEGISGAITIIGRADFDSMIIAGTMRVGSELIEDAEEHLRYLDVEVRERTGEIFVKTVQPQDSNGRSYIVDYNIIMPEDFASIVTNVNGCVTIDSTTGGISAENVNGQIYLNEVTSSASVSLVNGQIAATMFLTPGIGAFPCAT